MEKDTCYTVCMCCKQKKILLTKICETINLQHCYLLVAIAYLQAGECSKTCEYSVHL